MGMPPTTAAQARPSRAEIEPAALEIIRRRGPEILATARRYAATEHDAEDAYQRGLEILLTKAPSTHEDDLVPWLKTVVKHEAFAIRRQRERHGVPSEHDELTPAHIDTHEHVERLDRLGRGAEALKRLKPAEMRCMLLLAEGHSYAEICAITGFSYTKVNRCLAEGRQAFMQRVRGIESGAECKRLAPALSAAADGEASPDQMLELKRHLRGCLACRAALREARGVPARVAALAPAGVVAAPDAGPLAGAWDWLQERLSGLALRGQELMGTAAAHKTAALAASAALAGGGVTAVKVVEHHAPAKPAAAQAATAPTPAAPAAASAAVKPAAQAIRAADASRRSRTHAAHRGTARPRATTLPPAAAPAPATAPRTAASSARAPSAPAPAGSGAGEFGP